MNIDLTMSSQRSVRSAVELSVVIPTFNERDNLPELVERLDAVLAGVSWEAIVVDDDSPDGTAALALEMGQVNSRIRVVHRIGRRGLSTACIEGFMASSARFIAVIDADLQHDETLLPTMLETLRGGDLDIVVGSRYLRAGDVDDWDSARAAKSRLATRLSRLVQGAGLSDPMSGFFMMRREAWLATVRRLSGLGFKILLDIFASSPGPLRFRELPYRFRPRHAGESKLDDRAAWDFLMLLIDKRIGHILPARFVSFSIVGALGVVVHFSVLTAVFQGMHVDFAIAQAIATVAAMTGNFLLNNLLTYRDRRLGGRRLVRGWLSFTLACGLGAIANVGVATYVYGASMVWWLSALAGILVGAVWNYAMTRTYTWGRTRAS